MGPTALNMSIPARLEDWPCRTEPADPPSRLVAALYLLLRDHVAAGDLEQVCLHIRDHGADVAYTNPHLSAYAGALATYLTTPPIAREPGQRDGELPVGQRVRGLTWTWRGAITGGEFAPDDVLIAYHVKLDNDGQTIRMLPESLEAEEDQ